MPDWQIGRLNMGSGNIDASPPTVLLAWLGKAKMSNCIYVLNGGYANGLNISKQLDASFSNCTLFRFCVVLLRVG